MKQSHLFIQLELLNNSAGIWWTDKMTFEFFNNSAGCKSDDSRNLHDFWRIMRRSLAYYYEWHNSLSFIFFSCVDIQISWFWCHYHWSRTLFQSISKHCNECFCCAFELYFLSTSYLLIFKLAFSPFFQCCFIKYQLNLRFQDFFLIVLSGLYFFNVLILFPCCPIYLVSL